MDEIIREYPSQRPIGVLRTSPNGDVTAYDYPSYRALGMYAKSTNTTCELPSYRKVSTGNTVAHFFYKK